jgi:hypothetical protein
MGVNPYGGRHRPPGHREGREHLHHRFRYQVMVQIQITGTKFHPAILSPSSGTDRHTDTQTDRNGGGCITPPLLFFFEKEGRAKNGFVDWRASWRSEALSGDEAGYPTLPQAQAGKDREYGIPMRLARRPAVRARQCILA